jgi:hypothetical protein
LVFAASVWLLLWITGQLAAAEQRVKSLPGDSTIGLPVGAKAPAFELPDQNHRKRTLLSLMGPKGLVLVFFRSADW